MTEQGDVLEGTQTNFFAIIDNAVHTAKEGVLMGTVRGVLLEVGVMLHHPVRIAFCDPIVQELQAFVPTTFETLQSSCCLPVELWLL